VTSLSRERDLAPVPSEPASLREDLDAEIVLALDPDGRMAAFNRGGLLAAADIHVASALGRLGEDNDELVALAVALAVRAPRVGHVLADLYTVRETAIAGVEEQADLSQLPWPEPAPWLERLGCSPLVSVGEDGPGDRPLRLVGSSLYLDRYWRDETDVAVDLIARSNAPPLEVDEDLLAKGLARLYRDDQSGAGPGADRKAGPVGGDEEQRRAVVTALERRLSVIAGGPGTGKTTTVARLLALVIEQADAAGGQRPLIALAAPTGKAAARMAEAVHDEARRMDIDEPVRQLLLELGAATVHRLLGRRPGSSARFRHDRNNRLPHDVVVVDETSMMSLPLMARLVEAVRPDARLVLLGDQEQLASVEAGAVLGDIVGPAAAGGLASSGTSTPAPGASRHGREAAGAPSRVGECITVLRANYRFSGQLAELAGAIRSGDEEAVIAALTVGAAGAGTMGAGATGFVRWLAVDPTETGAASVEPVMSLVAQAGAPLFESARRGDGPGALNALDRFRLLCAHRAGPAGVSTWNYLAEQCLASGGVGGSAGPGPTGRDLKAGLTDTGLIERGPTGRYLTAGDLTERGLSERDWYMGRPVIVTENDYGLGLFNGDTGVVIAREDGGLSVAFRRGGGIVPVSPSRLGAVETGFAMTVHRAQGSEFDVVVVLLPSASSRVLTRELLYTAVTRARRGLFLVGTEGSVRAAVSRPIARASGLTARLWGHCG
jgi:exodeoxyribonuclease V alpha subunit